MIGTLLRPWRTSRTWKSLCFLALDMVFCVITFAVVVTLLATTFGLLVTFPFAVITAWLLFVSAKLFGRIERSRLSALLDLDLPDPHPPLPRGNWFRRLWARVTTPSRWKEIAYLLVRFPVAIIGYAVTISVWAAAGAVAALPLYGYALPGDSAEFGLFDLEYGPGVFLASVLGILGLLVVAPWVTFGFAELDRRLARGLLGESERAKHKADMARVEARRVAAVDSAEAERRRIERNLHDGAQARLVNVAMDLGRAEQQFDDDPQRARALVTTAHDETKAALAELRDLVRGFHPAILEDRGLDAALSAIVARNPVPVALNIDVAHRPPSTVESAAYYVVVEALTNVGRHSGATKASVSIARRGDRLAIDVTDNGVGGADPARGTGLHGLQERVQGLGGWMHVLSPAGGPTTVLVELPCAS